MKDDGYVNRVDDLMKDVRQYLLGQNTRLDTLLPPHLVKASAAEKATYLADRLLFSILKDNDELPLLPISALRLWLEETILFLFTRCNPNDWTLGNVRRMMDLDQGIRELLFGEDACKGMFPRMRTDIIPKPIRDDMDAAFLEFVPPEHVKAVYNQFKQAVRRQ